MRQRPLVKRTVNILLAIMVLVAIGTAGCVSTGGTAAKHHQKLLGGVTENEYHIPKRPVDRAYIGAPWSKQFGPIENPDADEIRTKKERSLDNIQQDFAFKTGIGLGGQLVAGPVGEVGMEGGSAEKARLEGVEIISPISLADIPFEPGVPYVTEALRLKNFRINTDKSNKAGINVSASTGVATASATAEVGSRGKTGTEGEGLVVAYKLHEISKSTFKKNDSGGFKPLNLEESLDITEANVVISAKLYTVEPGSGKSLPRNILWACDYAEAKSRNIIAAWIVEVRPLDPKRRPLLIGFPGYPTFENCMNFSGVIYSYIDPLTDKIHRQKINVSLIAAELSNTLETSKWDARVSFVEESFKIKLVLPFEMNAQN